MSATITFEPFLTKKVEAKDLTKKFEGNVVKQVLSIIFALPNFIKALF